MTRHFDRPNTVGKPIRRLEDEALLVGRGRFMDDLQPAGVLTGFVVRSQMAHARFSIRNLDEVRALPGVELVLGFEDIADFGPMPVRLASTQPDGSKPVAPDRRVLASGVARFVGEPLAFLVATDRDAARDAAERIEVDYVQLPAVTRGSEALAEGAPVLHERPDGNQAFEYRLGDEEATSRAFERASRVTRVKLVNNRVCAAFLETRGIVAEYEAAGGRYTLTIGCQGGHVIRRMLSGILGVDQSRIRILTYDVGGAFGTKMFTYPEYALAAVAAERLGRPVKWIADRYEHFVGDAQGRDHETTVEMAMDDEGRFLAMRVDTIANLGAYCSEVGAWLPFGSAKMGAGCYDIQRLYTRVRGAYTNTMPVDSYRGAGRPEAAYLIERLVDACARETGIAPDEIRRRNLISSAQMPYRTATEWVYDSGDFVGHLDAALEHADHAGFREREAESARGGMLRGIGIAVHIDACAPAGKEEATLSLGGDGEIVLKIGTQTGGQGHATSYAQYVVDRLGVPIDSVRMVQGDTDLIPTGGGTGGSRSIPLGVPSVDAAAVQLAENIRQAASDMLEAAPDDLELVGGQVRITGTDRAIDFAALARQMPAAALTVSEAIETTDRTFPNGTHVAEVEIDPETGQTRIISYTVVDDFGFVVNPMLLEGQIHGGVAQGIGQALLERVVFDRNGEILTASFLDYCVPRADDLPELGFATRNVPARTNPLGLKGAGEAGVMGSCPAVMNAVADALGRAGVTEWVDMPATPQYVWSLIDRAKGSRSRTMAD